MASLNNHIYNKILPKLITEMEILRNIAHEELQKAIQRYVYDSYDPVDYKRTYEFLNSVTSTDVKFNGNELSFEIYIDKARIHKSVVDGKYTYVAPLLDKGHKQSGYDEVDYFHVYPETNFWDKFIEEIKLDLNASMKNAVIQVFRTTKYR